jgi:uncharacterized protein
LKGADLPLTRRQFLGAGIAVAGGSLADATAIEPYRLRISRHALVVRGLAPALDGIRVAQVSDVHLPGTPAAAQAAAEIIARERPDIVVLTGDIIEQASSLPALEAFAASVRGRLGTFAVLGNWEHKAEISPATARAAYARAGVVFLCNEPATLSYRGARLRIVGFDDPVVGQPDPGRALAGPVPGAADLWLIHAPAYIDTLPSGTPRASVILSGHTHGGQIRLPGLTLFTPPGSGRYVSGWYHGPLGPLYVSRGIGTATIRMRFFCPPEVPILTLRAG